MNTITFETIKNTVSQSAINAFHLVKQGVIWSGHRLTAGFKQVMPIIASIWNQAYTVLSQFFAKVSTNMGLALGASFGLFCLSISAIRMANRPEYQFPEQRASRAFLRTFAAFSMVGAMGAALSIAVLPC